MFTLRELPFKVEALSDLCSEKTFSYHYGKHHLAYINNLNAAIEGTDLANASLYDIIATQSGGIYNNAAQIFNHDFFWDCMTGAKSTPDKALEDAIAKDFGSLAEFKKSFKATSASLFGSGWTWLVYDIHAKKLEILPLSNANTPINEGKVPLLVVDVWEHAYYLDYQNARPAFLDKYVEHINWDFVGQAYEWALKEGLNSTRFYIEGLHPVKASR